MGEKLANLNKTLELLLLISAIVVIYTSQKGGVRYWHYQLQNASFDGLKSLDAEFIVVDPDDSGLNGSQLKELKRSGKIVLAYLSIGEAEDYRDYWNLSWVREIVGPENPEWPGNYPVKFWDERWKKLMLERAEEIENMGYSGLYLDKADVYEFWEELGRKNASLEISSFICWLSNNTKKKNPGFLIFVQNAPELYPSISSCIDGIGKEDTWYEGNRMKSYKEIQLEGGLRTLLLAEKEGKIVLAIDYPQDMDRICDFYKKCSASGFYCTVSSLQLNLSEPRKCGG